MNEIKSQKKERNEMEVSNLRHTEFETLVIRIFKELSEDFNEEIVITEKK